MKGSTSHYPFLNPPLLNFSSKMHSPKQDYSPVERRAVKFSYNIATETKKYSISVIKTKKYSITVIKIVRGILESSSTTIAASTAINTLISYMKIKLESCRTAEFCQNISISSFILNPKLATGGALLQPFPPPPKCWWCVCAHIGASFFQKLFSLNIGRRGRQLNFDPVSKPS